MHARVRRESAEDKMKERREKTAGEGEGRGGDAAGFTLMLLPKEGGRERERKRERGRFSFIPSLTLSLYLPPSSSAAALLLGLYCTVLTNCGIFMPNCGWPRTLSDVVASNQRRTSSFHAIVSSTNTVQYIVR